MKRPGEPTAWDNHGYVMDAAMKMSKAMNCKVRVRSWKFKHAFTGVNIWVYGFGGKA